MFTCRVNVTRHSSFTSAEVWRSYSKWRMVTNEWGTSFKLNVILAGIMFLLGSSIMCLACLCAYRLCEIGPRSLGEFLMNNPWLPHLLEDSIPSLLSWRCQALLLKILCYLSWLDRPIQFCEKNISITMYTSYDAGLILLAYTVVRGVYTME